MARPVLTVPRWAYGGSSSKLEPDTAKKELGWIVEIPTLQNWNWIMYSQGEFIKHFDEDKAEKIKARVSGLTIETVAPNESLLLSNSLSRVVDISSDIVDNDVVEIKDSALAANDTDFVTINAPAGFTFEDGSSDCIMNIAGATFTFLVNGAKLYLV